MNPSDLKLPWYLENWCFITIAVIAAVVPVVAFLLIPLILMRSNAEKAHIAQGAISIHAPA